MEKGRKKGQSVHASYLSKEVPKSRYRILLHTSYRPAMNWEFYYCGREDIEIYDTIASFPLNDFCPLYQIILTITHLF